MGGIWGRLRRRAFVVPLAFLIGICGLLAPSADAQQPGRYNLATTTDVANWKITNAAGTAMARYFAVDNENGLDSRSCYYDAAVGTTFTTEMTSRACKTSERIREILPRFGASRRAIILFKPRSDNGNFKKKDGITNDWLDIAYSGYSFIRFRGSDLTNSTNDQTDLGGVVDNAGPNGDSSWTSTGAYSGFQFTITGALPAQDTVTGNKIRYKGNVTAGARAIGGQVMARTGATTGEVQQTTTIANLDDFFLETPGVKFTTLVGTPGVNGPDDFSFAGLQVVGIRFTAAVGANNYLLTGPVTMSFVRFDAATSIIATAPFNIGGGALNDEAGVSRSIRCGADARNTFSIKGPSNVNGAFHNTLTATEAKSPGSTLGTTGLYALNQVILRGCGEAGAIDSATNGFGFGSAVPATFRKSNLIAGVQVRASAVRIGAIDVTGATKGVEVLGDDSFVNAITVTGVAGTTAYDLSAAGGSRIFIKSGSTATGGTQDVLMAGSVTASLASLATSGQFDDQGNVVTGSAGLIVKKTIFKFSGAHIGAAGAATSYFADDQSISAAAITTALNYPMPAGRVRNLRIKCPTNALGANMTATIYKNGSATTVVATVTTGSTAVFTDTTHEAQFAAGDYLDLRGDSTAAGVNTAECAATAEVY